MKNILFILLMIFGLVSCNSDDDICISGEATPRLKLKFKESTENKILKLDSLIVDVDYGNELKTVVKKGLVDSVFIPLRVDDSGFTDIYVRTATDGTRSKIKINYNVESQYVSPACGFKRLYKEVSARVETPNPVTNVEQIQTEITNENGDHLFLIF